jgi:hypothetical protein
MGVFRGVRKLVYKRWYPQSIGVAVFFMTDASIDSLIRDLLAIHMDYELVDRTAAVVALIDLCQYMIEEPTDIQGKAFDSSDKRRHPFNV